jgi:hypothetical protein
MRARQLMAGVMFGLVTMGVAAPASAQATGSLPVTFDVVGGINISTLSVPLLPPTFDDLGVDFSVGNRVGFVAGVLVGIPMADGIAIETGGLISFRGSSLDITFEEVGTASGSFKLTYLDVPGLGRFRVARGSSATVHALAGVTLGLKLAASQEVSFMGQTVSDDLDGVSAIDLGLTFGGRIEIGRALIDVRYTLGMLNLADESGEGGETIKNRSLGIMGGWRF